jgi:hypothetical protein
LGFLLGRQLYFHGDGPNALPVAIFEKPLKLYLEFLHSDEVFWKIGAAKAVAETCRYGPIDSKHIPKLMDTLINLSKNQKDNKILDHGLRAIAHVCASNVSFVNIF